MKIFKFRADIFSCVRKGNLDLEDFFKKKKKKDKLNIFGYIVSDIEKRDIWTILDLLLILK